MQLKINNNFNALKLFIICILCCAITACGFKLRSQDELPPQLHQLYFETDNPYGNFESLLRRTLQSSGIDLVNNAKTAKFILTINKPVLATSSSTIGPSSQSRVYYVSYSVTFILKTKADKVLLGPETIASNSSLTLGANQLLQSNNQLNSMENELQLDVINQIYNRLSSRQAFDVLRKASKKSYESNF